MGSSNDLQGALRANIAPAQADSAAGRSVDPSAVEIDGVSVSFPSRGGVIEALADVSLNVGRNEFVSIVGRSGCGKSTLLRVISNLIPPNKGEIRIGGLSSADYQRRRKFGFVFQDASLFAWKTVRQNIELPLEVLGVGTAAERRRRVSELLSLVRLEGFGDHYPAQLSGGMRQRVSIARALSYEPEILLMDEPFGALDEFTRREMHDELIGIWKARGLTVVFVTHSLSEALYLSDEIVVMAPRPGRVKSIVPVVYPRVADPALRSSPAYVRQIEALEALLNEQ